MQDKPIEAPVRHEGASHPKPLGLHDNPPAKKGGAGKAILWLLILAAVAGGGYYYWHKSQASSQDQAATGGQGGGGGRRGGGAGGPVPVVVSPTVRQDLPVYLDGLGSVVPLNTVMLNTRVDGEIMEVDFKEGQDVKKGDQLAVIDPRPYQVALAQAQANLVRDQAQLRDAALNATRYVQLAKEGVIPQQQSDTQQALADQLKGAVESDQAAIDSAKLNIAYSHITSPINGRVGLRLIDPGNVVRAAAQTSTNGLLMITQMEPITVVFTLPEDTLTAVNNGMHHGTLAVKAMSRDNGTQLATGSLLTIDNVIDPTTGTYKSKAVFDNKDRVLWPSQFVNARLLLNTEKNTLVIPAAAIQNGAQGTFVYAVKPDKTVEVRPVTVSVREGNSASISAGLSEGDMVVTDGQDRLRAGMAVDARPDQSAASARVASNLTPAADDGAEGGKHHGKGNHADAGAGDAPTGNGAGHGGKHDHGERQGSKNASGDQYPPKS